MQIVGAVIGVLLVAQLAVSLVSSVQRSLGASRQRVLATDLLRQKIAAAKALRTGREMAQFSWNGYRKFAVAQRIDEADCQCSFLLTPQDGKPLPLYRPGQYLTFRIPLSERDKPVIRCYSLSDAPRSESYRVTIKRVPAPFDQPELPPGVISNWFHDHVQIGAILDVQAPRGDFQIEPMDAAPIVLIGGGIGITPVYSMAAAVVEQNPDRETWLFYGVRHGGEHAFRKEMRQLQHKAAGLRLRICYSEPRPVDVPGEDYDFPERISVGMLQRELRSSNYDFYLCGPPPMMAQIPAELEQWGVPASRIFSEAFGPATARKLSPPKAPAQRPALASAQKLKVTFRRSDRMLDWTGQFETLLEFAEANGVAIDSGCRAGNCGTCEVALLSGKILCRQAGANVADGSCLTCISAPDGDVVLDA